MSTTLKDVIEFIQEAKWDQLDEISDALENAGFEFTCDECEEHECEVHDSTEDVALAKHQFLQHLSNRLDQFGLSDMLSELEDECRILGVNLKLERGNA